MFPFTVFLKIFIETYIFFIKFILFFRELVLTIIMDRAGTSRDIDVRDKDFTHRVNMMLDDSFSGEESDLDDPVDNSDADPDFILPNETNHQADVLSGLSQSESENGMLT